GPRLHRLGRLARRPGGHRRLQDRGRAALLPQRQQERRLTPDRSLRCNATSCVVPESVYTRTMFGSGTADTFLLGVDGGGTQCRLRLRSGDGTLVGEANGGPSNIRFDPETVARSILAACHAIL